MNTPSGARLSSLGVLEHAWARGLLSTDELVGCLLRYLVRQEQQERRTENGESSETRQEQRTENGEPAETRGGPGGGQAGRDGQGGDDISRLKAHNAILKAQLLVLNTVLRQLGDALDGLTGQQLDLWQSNGLWLWRWEDTGQQSPRGLASQGEALVDAVERRGGLLLGADPLGETA
ncbi:MAG TPA: hypothetical protein VFS21_38040 [Roseiflexaceae bacterium]|nr:hypothetical protein [Roseiflexaceae bacterium]